MIDAAGEVLYVGKAKSIKKRIVNYARPAGHDTRIMRMIAATHHIEFVTTRTETEALLLEANLIKRLRPRFNVLMRDDKSFPYILITADHPAPQIVKHRGARNRPGDYFGPFASVWAVNRTITALERAFLIRSCSDAVYESRTRPCLLHQIKRCSAPCTGEITPDDYAELVREARAFLSGKSHGGEGAACGGNGEGVARRSISNAPRSIATASRRCPPFHRSRASIRAASRKPMCSRSTRPADSIACRCSFSAPGRTGATAPIFRRPTVRCRRPRCCPRSLRNSTTTSPARALILISDDFSERELLAEALSAKSGYGVEVAAPKRGEKKDLIDHALANAREALGRKLAETSSQQKLLKALAEVFQLPRVPRRIEVYDNSHIQGSNAVGAMIVAGEEGFRKNQYRKFNIRSQDITAGDDYGMMREVLTRRFKRLMDENPRATGFAEAAAGAIAQAVETVTGGIDDLPEDVPPWPDLVLIDGGLGQLNAARETLRRWASPTCR